MVKMDPGQGTKMALPNPLLDPVAKVLFASIRRLGGTPILWGALVACITLAGCTAVPEPQDDRFKTETRDMFAIILRDIRDTYIEEQRLETLTLVGLESLSELDPDITIVNENETVQLVSYGTKVMEVAWPSFANPGTLSDVASEIIVAARTTSTPMRELPPEALYSSVFSAMTGMLDRYSRYAGSADARSNREGREGFGGIGITIGDHPLGARVLTVLEDNPAQAAGVHAGDVVTAIDGRSLSGTPLRRIIRMTRGPLDKPIVLTLQRQGLSDPLVVTVGRTRIVPNTVFLTRGGGMPILRVTAFNDRTAKQVAEAISEAKAASAGELNGLVLDLRGNPGGLLDRAIDVADLFLQTGIISLTDGRHPRSFQEFRAEPGDISEGVPIVVLIDGASASAAEVLAAALQDAGRAVVVGASSFGKGSVQTVLDLPNGGELILTWARLLAPSGYALQNGGVMPNLCTQGTEQPDQLITHLLINDPATALHNLALRRRLASEDFAGANHLATLCPWRPGEGEQIDEAVARKLLNDPDLYEAAVGLVAGTGL